MKISLEPEELTELKYLMCQQTFTWPLNKLIRVLKGEVTSKFLLVYHKLCTFICILTKPQQKLFFCCKTT